MPEIPVSAIVKEMKGKPFTMLTIIGILVAVTYLWQTTASAQDVKVLYAEVTQINVGLIEAKLERVEAQLFDIQAKITDKAAAHQEVDSIYTDKLKELLALKAHIERELQAVSKK
jgi:hypothetical protein